MDNASLTVTVTVTNGVVGLSQTNGLTFTTGSGTNGTQTFSGTLADLNAALTNLYYLGAANYHGSDTLVVVADDGLLQTTNTVGLTVTAVNDAPTLAAIANPAAILVDAS